MAKTAWKQELRENVAARKEPIARGCRHRQKRPHTAEIAPLGLQQLQESNQPLTPTLLQL